MFSGHDTGHLATGAAISMTGLTGTYLFQHINEIAMCVSVVATVFGVLIQAWVAYSNYRRKN